MQNCVWRKENNDWYLLMNDENKTVEKEEKKVPRNYLKDFFKYRWITKNLTFFLFLALIGVLYIANGHTSDRTIRDISKLENEIKELQYEYKTIKSEVMLKSEESQIIKAVEKTGLKTNKELPVRVKVTDK